MARPSFNGKPATSEDLYAVMDHFEQELEEEIRGLEGRLRVLEDWHVSMDAYARILKFTLGASAIGAIVSIINLLGMLRGAG